MEMCSVTQTPAANIVGHEIEPTHGEFPVGFCIAFINTLIRPGLDRANSEFAPTGYSMRPGYSACAQAIIADDKSSNSTGKETMWWDFYTDSTIPALISKKIPKIQ